MRTLRALLLRFSNTFRRSSDNNQFAQELESHLAMHTEDNVRAGMEPGEARRQAMLKLGGFAAMKESYRDQQGLPRLEAFIQDVRYALRRLRRDLSFATVVIATLALGIGATTGMFIVLRAVLLRPLPYTEPDRLFRLTETNPRKHWTTAPAAPANYADWRRLNHVFTDLACYVAENPSLTGFGDPSLTGFGEAKRLRAANVSGNLFQVLGVQPMLGRTFREEETYEGHERVVVLSYDLWKAQFGGDPSIIGRAISLNEKNYEVVGVMPPGFFFPSRETQLWKALGLRPRLFVEHRRPHYLDVIGRLRPGVSQDQAAEQMKAITARLERMYPETNTEMGVRLDRFHDVLSRDEKLPLQILMGAVALLFVIICSNVANLQLGRASARTREFGIRQALGAAQARLTGQLLTESMVISIFGGGFGLALAAAFPYFFPKLVPGAIPDFAELRLDSHVILFAIAVTLLAPMFFGLVPALRSARTGYLQDRSSIASRGNRSFRNALVASQVALSVVLVAGSALLIETLVKLESVDPGFEPDRAISFTLTMPDTRYHKSEDMIQTVDKIEQELRRQAGVEAAGISLVLPLRGWAWSSDATLEGREAGDYERELLYDCVTPDYFRAAGIKLLRGRDFNQFDRPQSNPVTIVNESLERAYFHGQSAVGKRIKFGRPDDKDPWETIVGVVADTKQDSMSNRVQPLAYYPFAQQTNDTVVFVVRGVGLTANMVRRAVQTVDANLAVDDVAPLQQVITNSVGKQRLRALLLTCFAALALVLAALGIYGVLAYSVAQRAKEIGVRLALGAPPPRLFGMVVSEGMYPVLGGSIVGVAGAFGAAKLLQSLLFGVTPTNPATYVVTCVIIVAVALGACALPAIRATRVDPLVSLREQ
jgi:putative ABC transport system permease protein